MVAENSVTYISENIPVVLLDYKDLVNEEADLSHAVGVAFGTDGLGVLAVKNVPGIVDCRSRVLPLAWQFAQLDDAVKAKYEVPPYYQRGWDCGHEAMKDGKPDHSKGSFYANPLVDSFAEVDQAVLAKYPGFFGDNVFPKEEIPDFEDALKCASRLMIETGKLVAKHCDKFVRKSVSDYKDEYLRSIITSSNYHVCRLLHYFPVAEPSTQADGDNADSWCGWHNDHGSLTALLPAMYHDAAGKEIKCPDPSAGLHIKSRSGTIVHVTCPTDYMLFQIGETAQIHSGGYMKATPHMVKAANNPGVSRSTLAVFMEPGPKEPMQTPEGCTTEETAAVKHLPPGVPTLSSRWRNETDDNFGEFSVRTIKAYYGSSM